MSRLPLTKGQYAIIDDDDFKYLNQWKWSALSGRTYYAVRCLSINGKRTMVYMHRFITNAPKNTQVDHVNGNGLDNRKENLRICNQTQNNANEKRRRDNKSGYKGVSWDKQRSKWITTLGFNKKRIYVGHFNDPKQAAKAYNEIAIKYFKNFSRLNSI